MVVVGWPGQPASSFAFLPKLYQDEAGPNQTRKQFQAVACENPNAVELAGRTGSKVVVTAPYRMAEIDPRWTVSSIPPWPRAHWEHGLYSRIGLQGGVWLRGVAWLWGWWNTPTTDASNCLATPHHSWPILSYVLCWFHSQKSTSWLPPKKFWIGRNQKPAWVPTPVV